MRSMMGSDFDLINYLPIETKTRKIRIETSLRISFLSNRIRLLRSNYNHKIYSEDDTIIREADESKVRKSKI